jgi:PST family polysaccharide transporter
MATAIHDDTNRDALKRASIRGVALTFGSQGVRFVLQFSAQIVLAHFLLPAQFGLVAMVAPVLSLVQVFNDLGLTQATVQRPSITQGELSALFWINLGVSLVLAGVLALAAPLVAWFYGQPALLWITMACGSLLIFSGAAAQQIALMNRHMRFGALATIDVACAAAAFVTGLVAAIAGCGAWSLILMQAANSFTIFALAWGLSDWRPHWPRRQEGIGSLLRFGGHLTGFNLLNYLQVNLSTILIGRFDGTAALGLYDRAYKLVIVPWWQISLPIDRVAVSLLSRLQGSDQDYRRAHLLMLQGLLMVAAPGLLWAATQSSLLVPLVLGPNWQGAAAIVGDLSLATILVPFGAAAYWLFVSQGRVQAQLHYGLASGLVLIASILAGLHWGPLGVARSYALFTPLILLLPVWGATRSGPVRLADIGRAVGPIGAGLLVSSAGLRALPAHGPLSLVADLVLAYAACGAAMLCLPAGRHILTGLWALKSYLLGRRTLAAGMSPL